MEPSDDDILRRVQHGDGAAYLALFDRYYLRVEGYARRQTQDSEAARDIASETFLRAYRNVGSYLRERNGSYLGYLLMICHRVILTERARSRIVLMQPLDALDDGADALAGTETLPLNQLLAEERRKMIGRALDDLPPDDREIVLLAFERDLSRQDIARVLNKPSVSAVTSHLHRAMQKLKIIVARQGYFHGECETRRK